MVNTHLRFEKYDHKTVANMDDVLHSASFMVVYIFFTSTEIRTVMEMECWKEWGEGPVIRQTGWKIILFVLSEFPKPPSVTLMTGCVCFS